MHADALIELALAEDAGMGDLTSEAIFSGEHRSRAVIAAKQSLVLSGLETAAGVFRRVDPSVTIHLRKSDGDRVGKGGIVLEAEGSTVSLLKAERTALNFLQHLSGIATLAARYAAAGRRLGIRIVDTRKTIPGLRTLAKAAVRAGGCSNHRASLSEHILIKDNHIAAAGAIRHAVEAARGRAPHTAKIEVEAATLDQVRECLAAKVEVILLDNMSPSQVRAAKRLVGRKALIEVSGGMTLRRLTAYARAGADVISIGALTHSAPAADLHMRIEPA